MKRKLFVLILSIITCFILIPGGYGKWYENVRVSGTIRVTPNPDILYEIEEKLYFLEEEALNASEKIHINGKRDIEISDTELEDILLEAETESEGEEPFFQTNDFEGDSNDG